MSHIIKKNPTLSPLWSLVSPARFCIRTWESEDAAVVYDVRSGDTHLIEPLGREVLYLLRDEPGTTESIRLKLLSLYAQEDHVSIIDLIPTILRDMCDVGLIVETYV
ncbi:HPr-rel-A system PqqD family peptide chaperone [Undibacterium sp. Ren11W]|uniref:HPr-rel-A system PqqD family peptide chaperone n=1 Tax=Undibacterium sp. Ren11W TaxID=3413045 RepID=UPI003BF24612